MYLKLALIPLLLLLLKRECQAKRENRVPPPEKEGILDQKPKSNSRHYRSVPQPRPTEETVLNGNYETPATDSSEDREQVVRRATLNLELKEMQELADIERQKIAQQSLAAELKIKERLIRKRYDLAKAAILQGSKADQEYKLEEEMENDLTPLETQQVIVGDPNIILQRKRWKRSVSGGQALRALHNIYEEKKSCGNFKCKPSYVPLN